MRLVLASKLVGTAGAMAPGHPAGDDTPDSSPGKELREWSSLIGIVTAIVGNILIALALNVQRYAHIRLHKERRRIRQRARAAERQAKLTYNGSYGTVAGEAPEAEASQRNGRYGADAETGETAPLIPRLEYQPSSATVYESEGEVEGDGDVDGEGEDGDQNGKTPPSTYLKSPYWWLGQVLITLGEMGNFLAYGFAPASIVSPLGVVALVSNCVIAPILFHEKFRQRDFWGVVIAVAGVVIVVLSAKQEETRLGPHDVWKAITTIEFEIYLAVTISLIAGLMWFSGKYGGRTILIDLGLVGLFGGYTALATKGVSSMLSSTLLRAFTTPITYMLIFVLLGTAIMQIRYVNRALQRFDSTEVIPIQFVMFTLCVIIGSAVLYRDFERTTLEQGTKFVGGCLFTFFGVFLITSGRPPKDDEDGLSSVDGIEETIGLAVQEGPGAAMDGAAGTAASRRSSRSSKSSRINFDSFMKPFSIQHDRGMPSLRMPTAPGVRPSLGSDSRLARSPPADDFASPHDIPANLSDTIPRISRASSASSASAVLVTEPSTPLHSGSVQPPFPTDGHTPPRPSIRSHSRHLNPPIISPSPFSSTVSAVVKDTLRKHSHSPLRNRTSLGRLRSSIRASLFIPDDDQDSDGSGSREPLFEPFVDDDDDETSPAPAEQPASDGRRRARSLSDTLGDFFRIKKKRKENDETDVESGVQDDDSTDE